MNYSRINNTEHPLFAKVWNLYKKSFPPEERRQLRTQKKIMNNPLYHFEVATENDKLIGLILWWEFEDIKYIEHLAILPRLRGKYYGLHVLKSVIEKSKTPILLEVEHPTTEINKRRINFYQRIGFILNEHDYKQPPYKKGGKFVPLMLMTFPEAITKKEAERFCEKYHPIIYKYLPYLIRTGKIPQTESKQH